MKIVFAFLFLFYALSGFSQSDNHKFIFSGGYGAGGSFFVRSYEESNNAGSGGSYYKKHFLGSNLSFGIGYKTSNKSELDLRFTRQQFSRRVIFTNNVNVIVNANIRHINNIFELLYCRNVAVSRTSIIGAGLGIYFLRLQQEEVDVSPSGILWEERNYAYNKLEEAGVFLESNAEFKFQPRVHLGLRIQFYYTISTGEPESITLYPYLKLCL